MWGLKLSVAGLLGLSVTFLILFLLDPFSQDSGRREARDEAELDEPAVEEPGPLRGDSSVFPIVLTRPESREEILESWPLPGRLHGFVLNGSGEEIEGAEVVALIDAESSFSSLVGGLLPPIEFTTHSDSKGRYQLEVDWPYPFLLRATLDGMAPAVAVAVQGERVDLVLTPGATLLVQVRNPRGQSVRAAKVKLVKGQSRRDSWTGITGQDGNCRLSGLPGGEAVLVVSSEVSSQWKGQLDLEPSSEAIVEVHLENSGSVEGVVSDSVSGEPVAGATISLHYKEHRHVRSDTSGFYRLRGVPLSRIWDIHAKASGYSVATSYVGFEGDGEEVRMPKRMDFSLKRGRKITGRVIAGGEPIVGARVLACGYYVEPGDGPIDADRQGAETNAVGEFSLVDLRTDTKYGLLVYRPGYARSVRSVPPGAAPQLDLGDIELVEGTRIEGLVSDSLANPVEKVHVTLKYEEVSTGSSALTSFRGNLANLMPSVLHSEASRTLADGFFSFVEVEPGSYEIELGKEGFVSAKRILSVDHQGMRRLDVRLKRSTTVFGAVTDVNGNAVQGARVSIRYPGRHDAMATERIEFEGKCVSDGGGSYSIPGVPSGSSVLEVKGDGFVPYREELELAEPVWSEARRHVPVILEGIREPGDEEIRDLSMKLGWDIDLAARVLAAYRWSDRRGERERTLAEILSEEDLKRAMDYFCHRRVQTIKDGLPARIQARLGGLEAVRRLEEARSIQLRDLLVKASQRILDIAYEPALGLDEGRREDLDYWKGLSSRQEEVKGNLRQRLTERFGSSVGEAVYRSWASFNDTEGKSLAP